jgi:hypothetical protein
VDDIALAAVEHALGGALDRDWDADPDDDFPFKLVGADYSLDQLLDFYAGTVGRDPNEILLSPGDPNLPGFTGVPVYEDTRVHYHTHDLIRALIAEVRRLRGGER